MAEITEKHIIKLYDIAKDIHEKRISQKVGLADLIAFGIKKSSASDYVYNYKCMMSGKLMTRNMNAFGTKYFLEKIYEHGGKKKLQMALISLSAHIDYYENVSNSRVVKRRQIYDSLLSLLDKEIQIIYPDEIDESEVFIEGKSKRVYVNVYERNSAARQKCIEHHGYKCQVCEFDFEEKYGEIGKEFIHVHHINDISTIGTEYELNPITDLIPVCPNCHAMLHKKKPAYKIEEIRILF